MAKKLTKKETKIEAYLQMIMSELEIKVTEENRETPARIARMLSRDLFKNVNDNDSILSEMSTFKNPDCINEEPIVIKDIPFSSMCEHHWLPFFGMAKVEYVPRDVILGLSKFPRVVKFFSKRPQVQERLTFEIGEFLVNLLNPKYLKITLYDVTHTCVLVRGIESPCTTDSSYVFGIKE